MRRLLAPLVFCFVLIGSGLALAQGGLPPAVEAALARAKLPRDAVTLLVADAEGLQPPRLAWRTEVPMNPASIMKLVTTYAGLDLLGPAYVWKTPVYYDGRIVRGVLHGNLYLQGQGDPKLVLERLWLLLRRVQGLGIHTLAGDIVLDRSAFQLPADTDAAAFDGEPLRPYNAAPDALLLNFKSLVMTFQPDSAGQTALLQYEPPLAGVALPASVPLQPGADCGDSAVCGEKQWAIAYPDPPRHAARAVAGLWAEMGGQLQGQVRDGPVPPGLRPAFTLESPPLAEVIRDINKYSNNVMAQQLFLTLGLPGQSSSNLPAARAAMNRWWQTRIASGNSNGATASAPVFDNGSGLSREERISAAALGLMLQQAWRSPLMSELMASLPAAGVDGTLRRRALRGGGSAHLKTGTLRDVSGIAGFVDGARGRRYVLVAIANHANAGASRAAFDALVDWAAQDD